MTFQHLIQQLNNEFSTHIVSSGQEWEIQDIALLDTRQKDFFHNTLYFGYDHQMKDCNDSSIQCILADTGNSTACSAYLGNCALVDEASLFAAFNYAKTMIESTRSKGLYEELAALADRTRSMEAVLNAASIRLGNSLVLNDINFKIIASSTSIPVIDPLWKSNIRQGYCNYDFIGAVRLLEPLKNAAQTTDAVEVTCTESPYRKLSSKVFHNGVQVGFILMIGGETAILPVHREMLSTLSQVISYILAHYMPDLFPVTSPHQQLLYDLLIGAPSEEIAPRLSGIAFPPKMSALCISPTQYLGSRYLKDHTVKNLKRLFPGTHVTYHKKNVIAVIPLEEDGDISGEHLEKLGDFSRKEHVRIGISNAFSQINNFMLHYEQANSALELGMKLSPGENICYYLDYQIFDLFSGMKSPESLGRFCHPALTLLRQYDHKNNTQFYQTLCAYLDCGCSIKMTAEQLYIHRNSLVYRLNRITDVCRVDLDDTQTCFLLRLSFLIDKYNGLNQEQLMSKMFRCKSPNSAI